MNTYDVYMQILDVCVLYMYACEHVKERDPRLAQRSAVGNSNPKSYHLVSAYSGPDKAKYFMYTISFKAHTISLSGLILSILHMRFVFGS